MLCLGIYLIIFGAWKLGEYTGTGKSPTVGIAPPAGGTPELRKTWGIVVSHTDSHKESYQQAGITYSKLVPGTVTVKLQNGSVWTGEDFGVSPCVVGNSADVSVLAVPSTGVVSEVVMVDCKPNSEWITKHWEGKGK